MYVRGGRYLVVINPRREQASCRYDGATEARLLEGDGVRVADGVIDAQGFGYGVFELDGPRTER